MIAARPPRLAHLALTSFVVLTALRVTVRADQDGDLGAWYLLRIDPCVRAGSGAIAQQVATELGRLRDRPRATTGPVMLRVSCQGEQNLLVARLPRSGAELVRTLDVHLLPDELRVRVLALTAAELLAAGAAEDEQEATESQAPSNNEPRAPAADDKPATAPFPPRANPAAAGFSPLSSAAPPAVAPAPLRTSSPALRIFALAAYQVFLREPLSLWGGGAGVGWDSARHVGFTVDLLVRRGTATLELGTISVDTLSAGGTAQLSYGWTRLRLRTGVGLRGGLVRMHGQPADPARTEGDSFLGGWLGSALVLGATVRLSRRIVLELTAEGGYVVLPVIGQYASDSAHAAAIAGPFLGLQLGLGVFP